MRRIRGHAWLLVAAAVACDGRAAAPEVRAEPVEAAPARASDAGECALPVGSCAVDAECDDGCYCNGPEACVGGTCARAPKSPCEDDLACTDFECLEEADACVPVPVDARCSNGDPRDGDEVCDPAVGCVPAEPLGPPPTPEPAPTPTPAAR